MHGLIKSEGFDSTSEKLTTRRRRKGLAFDSCGTPKDVDVEFSTKYLNNVIIKKIYV